MSGELERFRDIGVPALRDSLEQRFPQPPWITEAGQQDRQNQGKHLVHMRELGREIERDQADIYKHLTHDTSRRRAKAQALREAKWELLRARRESVAYADEDNELRSKFIVLDDDFFHGERSILIRDLDDS